MLKKLSLLIATSLSAVLLLIIVVQPSAAVTLPANATLISTEGQANLPQAFQPITLTVVISASKDAFILSNSPDNNAGGDEAVSAGRSGAPDTRRGLIAFDIAGNVPSAATIMTTTLDLSVVLVPSSGGVNSNFGFHVINTDWGEGTKIGRNGSAASAGEVTWNSAAHGTTLWATSGGDFVASPSVTTSVTGLGAYTWNSTSQMVSDVQGWLDAPATNFGWLLKSDDEVSNRTARRFGSTEGGSPAALTVVYVIEADNIVYLPLLIKDS